MGKRRKSVSRGAQQRVRNNPLTGKQDTIPGTKAGKKRQRLAPGDPLRTHDIHGPVDGRKGRRSSPKVLLDEG